MQQFRAGAVNIVALLQVQQSYQTAVIARVQAQTQRLTDTAGLYQALGGGWWNRPKPLEEKKPFCSECGKPMNPGTKFCGECGAKQGG